MSEKPILFNTQMVQAILDGKKTQTRRLPSSRIRNKWLSWDEYQCAVAPPGSILATEEGFYKKHPPYKEGDILYVRETWNYGYVDSDCKECCPPEYWFEEDDYKKKDSHPRFIINRFWYKADKDDEADMDGLGGRWRPSIHMPKEAARIFLRVTNVRLERLKDISERDAISEGFDEEPIKDRNTNINFMCSVDCLQGSARGKFALLWNTTVKPDTKDIYGWDANPWVWAYTFERIDNPREAKA